MHARFSRWSWWPALIAFAVGTTDLAAQVGSTSTRKADLDLPFNAGSDNDQDESAPELLLLYGEAYEGDLFVIVGTPVT